MASRSWEARLTLKGPVVNIDFCGADEDDESYDFQECLRRSRSEPDLHKLPRSHNYFSQVRITIDPFSQRTSEGDDLSQASLKLEGVVNKKHEDSLHFSTHGDDDALNSLEGRCPLDNAIAKNKRPQKARPCKGQRIRHQKLEARLMSEIEQRPEVFDFDGMALPPSFAKDASRKRRLVTKLQAYKHNVMREREIENILRPLCDPYPIGGANIPYARDYSMVPCVTMSNPLATVPAYQA
mmetsp:Transcript_44610/g.69555  ORF Transcript_44610/g.69555 Transcript_44610/m.69555 type:complete len:239 (-) Transcript_44610:209-925(-)